ncbi:MAG: cache domain-containing protein [Deltaproteobacteria bacterium]|nr:cache domain-containing protein [Deltaproteobacteria bacterium]
MNIKKLRHPFRTSWHNSIATRLSWASILVVVGALIAVGVGLIWIADQALRDNTHRLQEKTAEKTALIISDYVQNAVESLRLFEAVQPLVSLPPDRQKAALEKLFIGSRSLFSQITYLNQDGAEKARISRFHTFLPGELKNRAADPVFQTTLSGQTFIGPVHISPESGLLSIQIAIPVRAEKPAGVLEAEVNVTRLWQEIAKIQVGKTGYSYLVDKAGRFIAYQELATILQKHGQDMKAMKPVADFMAATPGALRRIHEYTGLTGERVIGLYEPIQGTNWAVVVELPTREAYVIRNRMTWYLAWLLCLATLIAGGIGLVVSRFLVQPLRALTLTVQSIGKGNLNTEVVEVRRRDEVGVLAGAFNQMQEELRTLYRGLQHQVAELTKVEEELRASEELYTKLIATIPDIVVRTDMNGQVLFVNDYALKISKYAKEEIIDRNMIEFIAPEDQEQAINNTVLMLERRLGPQEYHMVMKDGRKLLFEINSDVLRNEDGSPYGLVHVCRDITERKQAAEERRHLESQLLQSKKLESIGTLAGGIAHDFNNILMGIQGYASLMLMGIDKSHPHYEKLRAIEKQVQSGAELTRQLLGIARGGRYEVKSTDLNELIGNTASMFGRTKKEISIHEKYADPLWPVEVDRGQIGQVFLNLFVNAWQAMPTGGDLFLETVNVFLEAADVTPYETKPGSYVKASVTDKGVGMDEKTCQRIFDPFFTTKEMGRGTGLGLASAYGIIKGHSGFITVESEKGQGTSFHIHLPASQKSVIQEDSPSGEIKPGRGTILIVDDERTITEVTGEMLEGLGYQVLIAYSGQEALDIYGKNQEQIDLVILDMIMPGMGGGETFERMKSINPNVRVILSSGYSIDGQAEGIMERGVQSFLQKPFKMNDLSQKIREVLEN